MWNLPGPGIEPTSPSIGWRILYHWAPQEAWANTFKATSYASQFRKRHFSPAFSFSAVSLTRVRPIKNSIIHAQAYPILKLFSLTLNIPISILSQVQSTDIYSIPTVCQAQGISTKGKEISSSQWSTWGPSTMRFAVTPSIPPCREGLWDWWQLPDLPSQNDAVHAVELHLAVFQYKEYTDEKHMWAALSRKFSGVAITCAGGDAWNKAACELEGRAALILLPWVRGWTDCSGLLLPAVLPACFHLSLLICSSSASPHHPPSLPWLPRQALSARPLKDSMAWVCGAGRGGRESRQRCQISFCSIPTPCPIKIRYLFGCLLVPQGNHIPNEFVKKAIQFISVLIGQNPGQWDHYGWKWYLKEKNKSGIEKRVRINQGY